MTEPSKDEAGGSTLPVQGDRQERVPRIPNERDESADSQAGGEASGQRLGELAHDDIASGRVDTDKGPVLDKTYEKMRNESGGKPRP